MKHVLILYENTGAGHKRVADIIEQVLAEVPDLSVTSIAGSDLFHDVGAKLVNRLWNLLLRYDLIRLADLLVNYVFRIFVLPIVEVLQTNRYRSILGQMELDLIICTADGYGKLLGGYAQEHDIPFVIVNTEATVFLDLVHPHATHICYFPETAAAIRSVPFTTTYYRQHLNEQTSFIRKLSFVWGMLRDHALPGRWKTIVRLPDENAERLNDARCHAVGPLVGAEHFERKLKTEMREKHGIPQTQPCVLLASGSLGGRFLRRVLRTLVNNFDGPLTVLVLCGHDAPGLAFSQKVARKTSHTDVMPFGFTDCVDELLTATDAVIARPSAGIVLESLVHHVPIILPSKTTTNDRGMVDLICGQGLGYTFDNAAMIPQLLRQALAEREAIVGRINAHSWNGTNAPLTPELLFTRVSVGHPGKMPWA